MERNIFNVLLRCGCLFLIVIIEAFYSVITAIWCLKSRPKKVLHINKRLLISRIVIILYCIISFVYFSDATLGDSNIRLIIRNIEIPLTIFLQLLTILIGMLNFVSAKCIMTEGRLFINSQKISYKVSEHQNELYKIEIFIKGRLYKSMVCNEEMFSIIKKYYATMYID